jgi:hypothetical protein
MISPYCENIERFYGVDGSSFEGMVASKIGGGGVEMARN